MLIIKCLQHFILMRILGQSAWSSYLGIRLQFSVESKKNGQELVFLYLLYTDPPFKRSQVSPWALSCMVKKRLYHWTLWWSPFCRRRKGKWKSVWHHNVTLLPSCPLNSTSPGAVRCHHNVQYCCRNGGETVFEAQITILELQCINTQVENFVSL